jgi:tRNASer (uridine44-2'-O)-methyltransferase
MATHAFEPKDLTAEDPEFQLPDEVWASVFATPCGFEPSYFHQVMENLIKNPNITSSFLFRADIFYDSINDVGINTEEGSEHFSKFTQHMQADLRPIKTNVPKYQHQRTFVRQMVPRNPQLDKPLVQTCHLYNSKSEVPEEEKEVSLVLLIPHVSKADDMPFYHPSVKALAIIHEWIPAAKTGRLSIHYRLFADTELDNRLQRTALNLLKTTHKHATGQKAGYVKRVHHDLIVPQVAFQNTYTRLKATYAKVLINDWVEQTDPAKHVFEDLGIAAFLIELWKEMYTFPSATEKPEGEQEAAGNKKPPFPGFIDIGCGNGVLTSVLIQEGYEGWGFDARKRMTWAASPPTVSENLKEMLLVPQILQSGFLQDNHYSADVVVTTPFHNGVFPTGTFIISNHADELTPWTPLLAYLSESPFLAIPCCSHNLAGARCRFNNMPTSGQASVTTGPGPFAGSLARPKNNNGKQPSAYQGLTAYVAALAEELGFGVAKEMMRIPSTRNAAILGRVKPCEDTEQVERDDKEKKIKEILEREVGIVTVVGMQWVQRAQKIAQSKGNCH